jgi:hypothetical protein
LVGADKAAELIDALEPYSGSFFFGVKVDPHLGMAAVRQLEQLVKRYPLIRSCVLTP